MRRRIRDHSIVMKIAVMLRNIATTTTALTFEAFATLFVERARGGLASTRWLLQHERGIAQSMGSIHGRE